MNTYLLTYTHIFMTRNPQSVRRQQLVNAHNAEEAVTKLQEKYDQVTERTQNIEVTTSLAHNDTDCILVC